MTNNGPNINGRTSYGENVLTSIVTLAAKEIKGVNALQGRGVRISVNNQRLNIDLYINVFSGDKCSNVAFRVQENVKRSIESMTEYRVGQININVLGVTNEPPNSYQRDPLSLESAEKEAAMEEGALW
ncbi:MAG: Asp23/Gls24 family envelope stress response protein [Firmicutes bacterium]|nr:Asp23/Gls24 family envelope stress response protein [Bacillota bacterium]